METTLRGVRAAMVASAVPDDDGAFGEGEDLTLAGRVSDT
jgi:hypothetical protein